MDETSSLTENSPRVGRRMTIFQDIIPENLTESKGKTADQAEKGREKPGFFRIQRKKAQKTPMKRPKAARNFGRLLKGCHAGKG